MYVREPGGESTRLVAFNQFFGTRLTNTTVHENGLLFAVNRTLDRYEIWSTNGTTAGTSMVEQVTDSSADPLLGFQLIGDAIYFAATNGNPGESLWRVDAPEIEAVEPPMPPALVGDTNGDLLLDSRDIDAVFAASRANSTDSVFDVNGDGVVAATDGAYIVESIIGTKVGDLDLNGRVEFADFLILSTNFGQSATYAEGDADGDGMVGFADFLLMSANFGFERNA
jgi:ELWxxDGT repeat protein